MWVEMLKVMSMHRAFGMFVKIFPINTSNTDTDMIYFIDLIKKRKMTILCTIVNVIIFL